jgi:aquaporin Z
MAPLAIGASLMVMVYMGGHVSGGHYNPAVSLAVLLRGKMASTGEFVGYVLSQCLGAVAAALAVMAILGRTFAPAPAADASVGGALLVELLYTFALALVVLNSAASAKTHGNSFYGLAIGFTVLTGAVAVGSISGGAFNPAVGLGVVVMGLESLRQLGVYLVADLAGGAVAALAYRAVNGAE